MAKYINAQQLKSYVNSKGSWLSDWDTLGVLAAIDKQPAADVRPERHGKWIRREVGDFIPFCYHPPEEYECSVCQNTSKLPSSYCPNCGAKMDGKDGESNG